MKLFLYVLICLSLVSCTERKISRQLRSFCSETVTIPPDMAKVCDTAMVLNGTIPSVPVLVLYHDSLSCSSCQINHMSDLQDLYVLADSLGTFQVMTVFSPKLSEVPDVLRELKMHRADRYL